MNSRRIITSLVAVTGALAVGAAHAAASTESADSARLVALNATPDDSAMLVSATDSGIVTAALRHELDVNTEKDAPESEEATVATTTSTSTESETTTETQENRSTSATTTESESESETESESSHSATTESESHTTSTGSTSAGEDGARGGTGGGNG